MPIDITQYDDRSAIRFTMPAGEMTIVQSAPAESRSADAASSRSSPGYAWWILAVLLIVYTLSYIDRTVICSVAAIAIPIAIVVLCLGIRDYRRQLSSSG